MEIAGPTLTIFESFPISCPYCCEPEHGTAACNPPAWKRVFQKPNVGAVMEINRQERRKF